MVRLVVLNTSYTAAHIYDPDDGLTRSELVYLAEGVLLREREDFGRQLQMWSTIAPLFATATNYGFTGTADPFNTTVNSLRDASNRLLRRKPSAGAPSPAASSQDPDAPAAEPQRKGRPGGKPDDGIPDAIRYHGLFLANLGKPLP
jgi:hypothetical protein